MLPGGSPERASLGLLDYLFVAVSVHATRHGPAVLLDLVENPLRAHPLMTSAGEHGQMLPWQAVRVFLIHGMGRTQVSMALLARRLRAAGHRPSSFSYFVSRDTLERIAERLVAHVDTTRVDAGGDEGFAVVGHSLGNVITRMALPRLPALTRFVMLAPPNRAPVLARTLSANPLFRALTRDAGDKLADEDFFSRLPLPSVPTLIVAGTRGPRARWLPFSGAASDGVIGVEETRLPGVAHVEVPAIHTFIMNDAEVARLTLRFLEAGSLVESTDQRG